MSASYRLVEDGGRTATKPVKCNVLTHAITPWPRVWVFLPPGSKDFTRIPMSHCNRDSPLRICYARGTRRLADSFGTDVTDIKFKNSDTRHKHTHLQTTSLRVGP